MAAVESSEPDAGEMSAEEEQRLVAATEKLEAEYATRVSQLLQLSTVTDSHRAKLAQTRQELPTPDESAELRSLVRQLERLEAEIKQYDGVEGKLERATAVFESQFQERKRLQNLVHELKGNVRVFCRCRPVLKDERDKGMEQGVGFPTKGRLAVRPATGGSDVEDKRFEFDEIFPPGVSNTEIFPHVEPLCLSVLDGYNVCIFAYGQTGSGKTFTMEGIPEDRGINYETMDKIFSLMAQRSAEYSSTLSISLLEIYNETLRDLLDPRHGSAQEQKLEIRFDKVTGTSVPGLTKVLCNDLQDVKRTMNRGYAIRATASTAMNDQSSRSHCVLTVWVETTSVSKGVTSQGKLQLIDLAGSERLKKTGASGQQLKEAQNINRSLSALGNVVASRVSNNKHTPYRDSKLTLLLQDSLMGDSKVLMFVNINPLLSHSGETICSLRFAERANKVILGDAKKRGAAAGDAAAAGKSSPSGVAKEDASELAQIRQDIEDEVQELNEKMTDERRSLEDDTQHIVEDSEAKVAALRDEFRELKAEKEQLAEQARQISNQKAKMARMKKESEEKEAEGQALVEKHLEDAAKSKARAELRQKEEAARRAAQERKEAEKKAAREAKEARDAAREAAEKAAKEERETARQAIVLEQEAAKKAAREKREADKARREAAERAAQEKQEEQKAARRAAKEEREAAERAALREREAARRAAREKREAAEKAKREAAEKAAQEKRQEERERKRPSARR
eukprot:g5437.t1